MRISTALAALLPADPGYAPFGWRRLRGLGVLPLALAALLGLWWATENLLGDLVMLDGDRPLVALLAGFFSRILIYEITLLPTAAAVTFALNLSARRSTVVRAALLAVALLSGSLVFAATWIPVSCTLGAADPDWAPHCDAFSLDWISFASLMRATLSALLLAAPLVLHRRGLEVAAALLDAQLGRVNAEAQEAQTRLQSLQAQIEPHFLFNTLAHVQRLHELEPQQGVSMLDSLTEVMRSALPQMRSSESTLGRELALTRAYVHVQQIRMGERLRVRIAVPETLHDARLPPMMVLTLAENAVKHGLGPKRDGGTLRIEARQHQGRLEVAVHDDGVGLHLGAGAGMGLANTRARLATAHGREGRLDIGNNEAGGVSAVLSLPLHVLRHEAPAA
jgi:hypothetical protein